MYFGRRKGNEKGSKDKLRFLSVLSNFYYEKERKHKIIPTYKHSNGKIMITCPRHLIISINIKYPGMNDP